MQHIFGETWLCLCGKVPIDSERPAYQKIKTERGKPFYQELMKQLTTGYIDLRGIKLWYLVAKRMTITRLVEGTKSFPN